MDRAANYIALAIPVFFLLIGLELLIARLRKTKLYSFSDAITNISCGIGQQVLGAFLKTVLGVAYLAIHEHWRIWTLGADQWWVWVFAFLGVDFFYYWFHRYAHEISFLWGGHIVHHQSEEYNLSVALRQGAFQSATSWVFYLPLALVGLSPVVFIVINQFVTLYQFWIHTKLIGKMPRWFEFIFNTPSHHRVHHGVNPKYIDKNHAGTLIIWDRMFGTFQEEEEEVVYGITKPLRSWNPVWANLDYIKDVLVLMFKCRNPLDALKVLVKGPGWRPAYLGGIQKPGPVSAATFHKYETPSSPYLNGYVLGQYVVLLLGTTGFLFGSDQLLKTYPGWAGWAWMAVMATLIVVAISSLGGLLEGKGWAPAAELGRVVMSGVAIMLLAQGSAHAGWVAVGAGAYVALSALAYVLFARRSRVELA